MRPNFGVIFPLIVLLLSIGCAGCDEEDYQKIDRAAEVVQQTTEAGEMVMETPAGQMIPSVWRPWIYLAGTLLSGAAGAWVNWRVQTKPLKAVTGAIVKGVESCPDKGAGVKPAIQEQMVKAGVYAEGKQIVQQLK